jgi:hypothetical protein
LSNTRPPTPQKQLRALIRQARKDASRKKAWRGPAPRRPPRDFPAGEGNHEGARHPSDEAPAVADDQVIARMTTALDAVRVASSVSDRASAGVRRQGLPALKEWLTHALRNPVTLTNA